MTRSTLTRSDLSEAVHREIGLSRNESSQMVETILERISDALIAGDAVKISSFGTFAVRDKGARMGRNPKTGEEVPIDPRRVLVFRPSHILKDRVNAGNAAGNGNGD
jgi:integration host factor subunit alpha